MSKKPQPPYDNLGTLLKRMREKRQESLAEVSGAVEIEIDALSRMEAGAERPSEDILLLMISHFAVREDEASKLWELAGYEQGGLPVSQNAHDNNIQVSPAVMVLPLDARVVYTDMVHVVVNNYGVVINFMQAGQIGSQPLTVARVGMSKEHASSVLDVLQRTLSQSQQNTLPAATQDKSEQQSRESPS
ncbi:MAG: hypothetical protein NVS1B7_7910 [Candidatus Saccharimonadales bacterium]